MKSKDQTLLEQAYDAITESPFKFNDANTYHTDQGYDTGPKDVPQYAKSKSKSTKIPPPNEWSTRAYKKLLAAMESADVIADIHPDHLDRVIARLQQAKQDWGK